MKGRSEVEYETRTNRFKQYSKFWRFALAQRRKISRLR